MAAGWRVTVVLLFLCLDTVSGSLTNIALGKPVWQSSYHDITRFPAGNGVDGDTSSYIFTEASPNTQRESVWAVHLEREARDARVTVHFRNSKRNKGLRLYTSATNFTSNTDGDLCHTVPEQTPLMISVNCTGSWSFLKVYSDIVQKAFDKGSAIMDFAEVEVWACEVGKYGPSCSLSCDGRNCEGSNSRCNQWTGECVGGCQAGWEGVDCTQSCIEGEAYGRHCVSNCSSRHCLNPSASCDVQTGSCGECGCQAGWKGTTCVAGCLFGVSYGRNCQRSCKDRQCLNESVPCDGGTGSCGENRCRAGWMGLDCTIECEKGTTYGRNCVGACRNRHCLNTSSSCDAKEGYCGEVDGILCQAGWIGDDCSQEIKITLSSVVDYVVSGVIGAVITIITTLIILILIFLVRRHRANHTKTSGDSIGVKPHEMSTVEEDHSPTETDDIYVYNNDETATDNTYVYHNDEIATDNTRNLYNNDYTVMKTEDVEPQYHQYTAIETRRKLSLA